MAGQSCPLTSAPCIRNTSLQRVTWVSVSRRWFWKAVFRPGSVALSIMSGSAFRICCSA